MGLKQIKRALVSVYHKEGLEAIAGRLHALNIEIISTGGTKKYIEELDIPVRAVEEETDYPPIFGGRVKTLHPKVFGGILVRREEAGDAEQMKEHAIEPIDLVIVDLYPFEDTVRQGSGEQEIIEKIDIGGISLIRAAAKNYEDVVIISHRGQYQSLLDILEGNKAETTRKQRRKTGRRGISYLVPLRHDHF